MVPLKVVFFINQQKNWKGHHVRIWAQNFPENFIYLFNLKFLLIFSQDFLFEKQTQKKFAKILRKNHNIFFVKKILTKFYLIK